MKNGDNIIQHLSDVFETQQTHTNGHANTALADLRKKSFALLSDTLFPDRKHEDWKYTPVQKLVSPKYQLASTTEKSALSNIEGLDSHVITFTNGRADLSSSSAIFAQKGIKVYPLSDAFGQQNWKSAFNKWIEPTEDNTNRAFDFLNYSFNTAGFYLDIPAHTILEHPIEIRIVHNSNAVSFSHPLYFVYCGAGSKVEIIERFEPDSTLSNNGIEHLINSIGYLHLEKNAQVIFTKWQNLPLHQHLVYKLFVSQYRDSRFEMLSFDKGGNIVRNTIELELEEHNTFSSLQAGFYASGKQSMDHQTRINHKVAYCESHELYKGILDDQASAAFNGKVYVHQDAQKTNAYQQNDTLVLSPFAIMNSKPQLEIFADDVKCSHGATIGQLDERALFYLRSRGIRTEEAKQMLKNAFLAEVLDKIHDAYMREYISAQMTVKS